MKFCKDCFYKQDGRCIHHKNLRLDPVDGSVKFQWLGLSSLREDGWFGSIMYNTCGAAGRWFKKKD